MLKVSFGKEVLCITGRLFQEYFCANKEAPQSGNRTSDNIATVIAFIILSEKIPEQVLVSEYSLVSCCKSKLLLRLNKVIV